MLAEPICPRPREDIPTWCIRNGSCCCCSIHQFEIAISIVIISVVATVTGVLQLMRSRDEPVNRRIHKRKDDSSKIKQSEVKLLAQASQVSGQRHEANDPPFNASIDFLRIWIVQMGESP